MKRIPAFPLFFIMMALTFLLFTGGCGGHGTLTGTARSLYERGEQNYRHKNFSDAIEIYQQIQNEYPDSEYARRSLLRVADCHYRKNKLDEAATNYTDFLKFNANHPMAPYATYQLGMTNYVRLKTIDRDLTPLTEALAIFQEALKNFPDSPPYTEKIIQRINDCKRRFAKREFYVGFFYFKQKRYGAAVNRFRYLLATYPGFIDDKTLYFMGISYLNQGKSAEGQKALLALTSGFPQSPYTQEGRQFLEEKKGPGIKLGFLIRDYFIDKQGDIKDDYLTTAFMPANYSPRMAGLLLGQYHQKPTPPPEKVTFESLFRDRQSISGKTTTTTSKRPSIPDWTAGSSAGPQTTPGRSTKNTGQKKPGSATSRTGSAITPQPGYRQTPVSNLREPLEIISDWTEANRQQGTITFGGKVIAKQRDMVLYADQLTNYFDLETRSLVKAVASGSVKVNQADKFATCEQATLEQAQRIIVLQGNAVMWQGSNRVTGERIVIYLNTNQAEVFGKPDEKAKIR
ncbi:MAG: outer membrane protein assembly factor BamD, partial [Pseudomonadota bacterium]|nr:outer membrane protein assembly factor BamD [Pseudomonadota bacterium]